MPSRSFFALKPGRCCGSLAYRLQSHAVRNYRNETPSCHRSRACAGGTRTRARALGAQLSPLSYNATVKAYIIFRGFVRIVSADAGDDAAISFVLISFCSLFRQLQLLGMQRHFCRVRKNRITRHGHVYGLPCEYPDEAAKETAYKSIYRYSVQSLTPFPS